MLSYNFIIIKCTKEAYIEAEARGLRSHTLYVYVIF